MSDKIALCDQYNIVIQTRFKAIAGIAECMGDSAHGLIRRIHEVPGSHVVWDTEDDDQGFLLVGDDPEALAHAAIDHFDLNDL